MRLIPNEEDLNHRREMWQVIRWRMNAHRIDPEKLAKLTSYSKYSIERGIEGEPEPITFPFLCGCVKAFGIPSGRGKYFGDLLENRTIPELEDMLRPPPAMPPSQNDFWKRQE
jgi:hypothetical protein